MVSESSSETQRFDHLFRLIKSERFLKKQGIGSEVPFFICPYLPEQESAMKKMITQLKNQLNGQGVEVLHIDLYDLVIELLNKRGILNTVITKEFNLSKKQLFDMLQSVCDSKDHIIPLIANKMAAQSFDVMFLAGVGEVYPYIRSHNILNNLQSTAKEKPTILFFPGSYTHSDEGGASLNLFGRLHDDKYYRAFNIYLCEI
ncbi:MAG: DUF1788 domain-containing protein [Anaerolineaceae bacterium]